TCECSSDAKDCECQFIDGADDAIAFCVRDFDPGRFRIHQKHKCMVGRTTDHSQRGDQDDDRQKVKLQGQADSFPEITEFLSNSAKVGSSLSFCETMGFSTGHWMFRSGSFQ